MDTEFKKLIEISVSNDYLEIIPKDFIDNIFISDVQLKIQTLQEITDDIKNTIFEICGICCKSTSVEDIKNLSLQALSLSDIILNKINTIRTEFIGCYAYEMFEKSLKNMLAGSKLSRSYPKSFLNFSVFHFSLDGYPYNTPSEKQYTIQNIVPNSHTENVRFICISNIQAFLQFIQDTHTILITGDNSLEQLIKMSWSVAISLIGIYCEADILSKADRILSSLQPENVQIHSSFGVKYE